MCFRLAWSLKKVSLSKSPSPLLSQRTYKRHPLLQLLKLQPKIIKLIPRLLLQHLIFLHQTLNLLLRLLLLLLILKQLLLTPKQLLTLQLPHPQHLEIPHRQRLNLHRHCKQLPFTTPTAKNAVSIWHLKNSPIDLKSSRSNSPTKVSSRRLSHIKTTKLFSR